MTKPEFAAHTPSEANPQVWHGLKEHLEKVAAQCRDSAKKLGVGELGYYAGLWHDLGKYNPEFQAYLQKCHAAKLAGQKPPREKVPHAIHGAFLARELGCQPLGFLIAGHHAGLSNLKGENSLDQKLKNTEQRLIYQALLPMAVKEIPSVNTSEDLRSCFQPFGQDRIAVDFFLRLLFSCLIDADRLDTEKFVNPEQYQLRQERAHAVTIKQLWEVFEQKQQEFISNSKASISKVNQIRLDVYQKCLDAAELDPGVFRLCVPTGGGKTRSGLAFALKHAQEYQKDRVIFAVPYTSIIEQTVNVYREEIFQELGNAAVLEHHSATQAELNVSEKDLEQKESDENVQDSQIQAKLATQNWDAKLIVTTTVQLFESLLSHKPKRCRKLHNLVNSVIVLDEVQTLPIGLLSPILSVLKELVERYNVTVVLCTATQPALEGNTPYFKDSFPEESVKDIIPKDLAVQHFQALQRVHYEIPSQGETWTWERLVQDMKSNPAALVVLNTRRDAIAVLNTLGVQSNYTTEPIEERVVLTLGESGILHLSTLLCGKHRQVVLDEVRRRLKAGEPCQLISTQVVEAGVDLDFPVVYRAMGPLDRIVQAAGRCNREGRLTQGRVVIFNPAEGSQPPKGDYSKAIQKARELLQSPNFREAQLHEPDIFQQYFQDLYSLIADTNGQLDQKGIQELRQSWSFRDVGERFKLIEEDTVPIVILYDEVVRTRLQAIAYRGIWSDDRAFLQPYIVNLSNRVFQKLQDKEEVKPGSDLWQWTGNYDPIRGFPLEQADQEILYDPLFLTQ
jgi:CRISPR-associated endonuclease/helicase Cas3